MDRERGFIALHRRVHSSALYQSLSAEQRSVFVEVLFAAGWKPRRFMYAGKWVEVARGEFAETMETIADRAGVTVKVVRTTYAKLFAHDTTVGEKPFLTGRWTGTEPGRGLRILRVEKYDEYQSVGAPAGTASGATGAADRAGVGHGSGSAGAPSEQVQPGEPETNQGVQGDGDVWIELRRHLEPRIRAETWRRFFADLVGHRNGDTLVLEAKDDYRRAFVADNYAAFVAEQLDALGHPLNVKVISREEAA